jgi:hypothetical protein
LRLSELGGASSGRGRRTAGCVASLALWSLALVALRREAARAAAWEARSVA